MAGGQGWRVVLEDALRNWKESDQDVRNHAADWCTKGLDGPDGLDGEQLLGMDGLFTKLLPETGVLVTYLVRGFHWMIVIKEFKSTRPKPSPN